MLGGLGVGEVAVHWQTQQAGSADAHDMLGKG